MSLTDKTQKSADTDFAVINGGRMEASMAQINDQDAEIDLLELAYVLLDKIHYVILFFLLGAVLLNAFAFLYPFLSLRSGTKRYENG